MVKLQEETIFSSLSAIGVRVGLVTSSNVMFWLAVVELPLPSAKVQVTMVIPWAVIGNVVVVVPVIVPAQASVVVGATGVPEHSPRLTLAKVGVTGGVTSFSVMVKVVVSVFPLPSLAVIAMSCVVLCPLITVPEIGSWVLRMLPGVVQLSAAVVKPV